MYANDIIEQKNSILNYIEIIIFLRMITSIISLATCFIIIVLYLLLLYQVKFSNNPNKAESENNNTINNETTINSNKTNKIGLGSHYMFFLVLSNFLSALTEGSFYIKLYIIDQNSEKSKDYFEGFSQSNYCNIYAFFHNLFELSGICWTTMITKLFYNSTKIEITGTQKQQMTKAILYSLLFPLIICIFPFFFGGYGFAYTHCSFGKKEYLDDTNYTLSVIFGIILTIFISCNALFTIYALCKSYSFYKKKIKQLRDQNESEYSSLKIYVKLFFIFPIIIMVTRGMKLIQFFFDYIHKEDIKLIDIAFNYINSIFYCLTGTFDSAFCIFFFRGVYKNCCNSVNNQISNIETENMINNNFKEPITPTE